MTDNIIQIENLGKRYRIGVRDTPPENWREAIGSVMGASFHYLRQINRPPTEEETLWALRNVSFNVQQGEVLGIIGSNGAGKSTLLKILSRITEPTEGRAIINGRIGSLLEVGTGFHPELTGRENTYLNGAILGMKRHEIARKFDDIVAFAEMDKFIDTPVKRYSSGMYVRLAFAVAAHLEPDILIIDEVLAVGDSAFQRKCLGKIEEVSKHGRTVLFVSHNLPIIERLCTRVIRFSQGNIVNEGSADSVVNEYLSIEIDNLPEGSLMEDDLVSGYRLVRPLKEPTFNCSDPVSFTYDVISPVPLLNATAGIVIVDQKENPVLGASSTRQRIYGNGEGTHWRIICNLGEVPLNNGRYFVSVWLGDQDREYARFTKAFSLFISPADPFGWGLDLPAKWGHFYWKPEWTIDVVSGNGKASGDIQHASE